MSQDVSSKVKKIVADHLGIDEVKVTDESSFIDDLGADSLDIGILDVNTALILSTILSVMLDWIKPGETQLIVIFFFAYSIAKLFDIATIAAFEAA